MDGGVPGDKNGEFTLTSTASIVEDLAVAGIRMKPGYVSVCSMSDNSLATYVLAIGAGGPSYASD